MALIAPLVSRFRSLVAALVIVGVIFTATPAAAASMDVLDGAASEQSAEIASLGQVALPLDLSKAILSAEAASLAIFDGLEMTQEFVGKTERRKAAIEYGRNHAQDRLKALVERARAAKSYSDLSPTDRLVLKRLLGQ